LVFPCTVLWTCNGRGRLIMALKLLGTAVYA
jgi:hypothetical protein